MAGAWYLKSVMQVTMEMPDQVARHWGETPDAVGRHIMEDAAIEGYRAGRLTQRQVGAMLGLDYWQTETFLNQRAVPLNYSAADLADDNVTLEKILARS
jgi:predicted HTH domain antitoxin